MFLVDLAKACCRGLTPELFGYMVWGTWGGGYTKICKAKLFLPSSLCWALGPLLCCCWPVEGLLLIFMCLNIFNHDLYKLEKSPHFLLSFHVRHWEPFIFFFFLIFKSSSSEPSVNVCSVRWSSTKRPTENKSLILFQPVSPFTALRKKKTKKENSLFIICEVFVFDLFNIWFSFESCKFSFMNS